MMKINHNDNCTVLAKIYQQQKFSDLRYTVELIDALLLYHKQEIFALLLQHFIEMQ